MNVRRHERRAISPIVATVLIVAATLIAFAAVAGYVFGIFGSASSTANVQIVGVALKATAFTTAATTANTPTCGLSAAGSYVAMTNSGTAGTSVSSVSVSWAGSSNAVAVSGACNVGAAGASGATTYVLFGANTNLGANAVSGQAFSVQVTLANGAVLTYQSTWL